MAEILFIYFFYNVENILTKSAKKILFGRMPHILEHFLKIKPYLFILLAALHYKPIIYFMFNHQYCVHNL